MNFYKFLSTFVGHFCPPGSGSGFRIRIRIRIHRPDWIRIRIRIHNPDQNPGSGSVVSLKKCWIRIRILIKWKWIRNTASSGKFCRKQYSTLVVLKIAKQAPVHGILWNRKARAEKTWVWVEETSTLKMAFKNSAPGGGGPAGADPPERARGTHAIRSFGCSGNWGRRTSHLFLLWPRACDKINTGTVRTLSKSSRRKSLIFRHFPAPGDYRWHTLSDFEVTNKNQCSESVSVRFWAARIRIGSVLMFTDPDPSFNKQ